VRRGAVVPLFLALLLAGGACGGGDGGGSAGDALAETAEKLGEIKSGDLFLRVVASSGENELGFELDGPFALVEDGKLPVAEIEYTQIAGSRRGTATFVSTGDAAFVQVEDATYELPESELGALRKAGGGGGGGGLGELRIDGWLDNPELSDGGDVGGAETDKIVADLDPVAAANDLLALIGRLQGDEATRLEGRSADQLERAVESSSIEVYTGKDDRLLRRLVLEADFAATLPEELEELTLPRAHFEFVLEIADPNKDVEVKAPDDAQPLPGS
jgi:hypothetical protein